MRSIRVWKFFYKFIFSKISQKKGRESAFLLSFAGFSDLFLFYFLPII